MTERDKTFAEKIGPLSEADLQGQQSTRAEMAELRAKRIWRYIDPMKLLSMLHYKALFFPRLDHLGDPHEGALGRPNAEELLSRLQGLTDHDQVVRLVEEYNATRRPRVEGIAVSCWHAADCESAGMWSIYGPAGLGIAIESTVGHFIDAFTGYRDIYYMPVKYVDYEKQGAHPTFSGSAASLKRQEYQHEAEVRMWTPLSEEENILIAAYAASRKTGMAVGWLADGKWELADWSGLVPVGMVGPGVLVRGDMQKLIRAVYLAPGTPVSHADLILSLLAKYGLEAPVRPASLDRPRYDQLAV